MSATLAKPVPAPALARISPAAELDDALTQLELRIARRADELARTRSTHTAVDLHCWLIAEAEVLRAWLPAAELRPPEEPARATPRRNAADCATS